MGAWVRQAVRGGRAYQNLSASVNACNSSRSKLSSSLMLVFHTLARTCRAFLTGCKLSAGIQASRAFLGILGLQCNYSYVHK